MSEQSIFLAALEIADPDQRAAYLNEACVENPSLRKQVDALLAAHQRSGEFLDAPALRQMTGDAGNVAPGGETCAEQNAGQGEIGLSFLEASTAPGSRGRLHHYEIREVIGRGGCGIVLKAFDEKLQRTVAIKVMAPELAATSPARKRFLREARATAAVRHENVVSIYAVEEQPLPFLVMEYIDGQTLQQKLDANGPLEVRDVLRISHQIAGGLAAAHAKGLIHRDIKPGNILLEDGTDQVKITDFGLARSTDDASVTQSGVIAGTPLYMSPEQAQAHDIDQRSDLFSLGSVLYVMSSGRPPFRAATSLAVMKRVVEEQPRPIQGIIPDVPEWLVGIIAILHAKDPRRRFASAQEVGDLFGKCLAEFDKNGSVELPDDILAMIPPPTRDGKDSVQAEHPTAAYQAVSAPARRPTHLRNRKWAAAAIVLALLAGLGVTESTGITNLRGTVIRLFSPEGTLIVEVDDPGVSVTIDGEEIGITGAGVKEIRLKPGKYKLLASRGGKTVRQELVTVTRDGREVVRVSRESEPGPDKREPALPADPDRAAAEYIVSVGGSLQPDFAAKWTRVVPLEPFRLTGLSVEHSRDRTTDALAELLGRCPDLTSLNLRWTGTTDAGLAHLKNSTKLTTLALGPGIGDEGLAAFQNCKELEVLSLTGVGITDIGLAHFANCAKLNSLAVSHSSITEKGLAALGPLPHLEVLNVRWTLIANTAQLNSYPRLKALWLGPGISDEGLSQIKEFSDLTNLALVGKKGEFTAAGLARFRSCRKLECLTLSWNAGSDAMLAEIKDWPALTNLTLAEAFVTDDGLSHLKECKTLKALVISTRGPGVSKAMVEELRKALPECDIRWTKELSE